jgi:hypothetical protein
MAHEETKQDKRIQGLGSMTRLLKIFILLALPCFSLNSIALVTADVLPKGVRAGAFVWGQGVVSHSFDENGNRSSLVSPLNRTITLDDIAEAEPQVKTLERVLNGMNAEQLGSHLLMSNMYSDLKVTEQRYVTGLLWGITERFSLGLLVPVVKRSSEASFRIDNTDNAQAVLNRLGNIPQLREGVEEFIAAGVNENLYVQEIFTANGYSVPESSSFSSLGDIEIESRYRFFTSKLFDTGMRLMSPFLLRAMKLISLI